jgi:hypothetical protein
MGSVVIVVLQHLGRSAGLAEPLGQGIGHSRTSIWMNLSQP